MTSSKDIAAFRRTVWNYWKKNGRHELPWRKTADPYKILVSEVMLQQTQVSRVVEKYKSFIKKFPNVRALAKAPLSEVLKEWNGLGYNRRAKYLRDAAVMIVKEHRGVFPREYPSLRAIPGVGQYTANAVRVFAFDEPEVLVETNVRTAIIHHFLPKRSAIEDFDIEKIAAMAAVEQDPREWHSALFDYGSYLKHLGIRTNAQSAQYVRQSKFDGSLRQIRGGILRQLYSGKQPKGDMRTKLALAALERDGLIIKELQRGSTSAQDGKARIRGISKNARGSTSLKIRLKALGRDRLVKTEKEKGKWKIA